MLIGLILYNEAMLRELELLQGFLIRGHNCDNVRYAEDFRAVRKLHELLLNFVQKKGLNIKF